MPSAPTSFDVAIIGGGPAGGAAALGCLTRQLRTVLITRAAASPPRPLTCPGWLSPAAVRFCEEHGVALPSAAAPTRGLTLRSWDLKQSVEVKEAALAGRIVPPGVLAARLLETAQQGGVTVWRGAAVRHLELGEKCARLELADDRVIAAQVVLLADGAESPTARLANVEAARHSTERVSCALSTAGPAHSGDARLELVLGAGDGLQLATFARGPDQTRVMLLTRDHHHPADQQLQHLLERAHAAGLLPPGLRATPLRCLAGVALEMESHVGKRCLLIGDAGGFVSAFSNEGLYPALCSGWLAAQTVASACAAPVLQDELASFSAAWRGALAEYLRLPSTDLGLLLPMVFSNAQMSARVARAFLLGQPF
jgi:flavin-dependent dehydrogenase